MNPLKISSYSHEIFTDFSYLSSTCAEILTRVKAVVGEAKREAEERFGTKLSQDFEGNRKMFWKEVKRVQKGKQGEEMRVKARNETCWLKGTWIG